MTNREAVAALLSAASLVQQTAGPSTPLRSARDDKMKRLGSSMGTEDWRKKIPNPRVRVGGVEVRPLLNVADLTVLEGDFHVLVNVDLLRAQLHYALGLSQGRGHLINRLSL
jgi:hypothetical protein